MTTISSLASPHQLLALDLAALGDTYGHGWQRLGDRISARRDSTVLVYLGASGFPGLPEPDYVIDDDGAAITRLPSHEDVDEWPPQDQRPSIPAALAHLVDGLLVPWSDVYCVFGPDRPTPSRVESLVTVGGPAAPAGGLWASSPSEDAVVAALEEAQFFGRTATTTHDVTAIGFDAAIDTLRRNVHELGFTAASLADNPLANHDANYAAVWARDGVLTGLWTMCLDDADFDAAFRATIRSLIRHQAPSGLIPSNVRVASDTADYSGIGGIASIDSVIWFVIGAVRLAFNDGDRAFALEVADAVDRAMRWLAAHDANNDGLIEIPESSDWMDIFPRSYNVLYDEVLWWQACRDTSTLWKALGRDDADEWDRQAERVRTAILQQFWPTGDQLMELAGSSGGRFSPGEAHYLLSQITPFDYGWRCDVYANLLAGLSGLLDEPKCERLFAFLWGVGVNQPLPVRCLYPPILSGADDWKDYFLVNFLNLPDHYHNGGIWPFIGGLWVRFVASVGRVELAHRELVNLAEACRQGTTGEWEFNEWMHGQTGRPMGKTHQAWSAASYVRAYLAVHGDAHPRMFPTLDPAVLAD